MRHPDMKDHDGENCLYVIKRGLTTLTTIGRATGFFSYAREYFANQTRRDSIEWAILPYDNDSGAFSKGGDSGSIIASATGEFGGLLTGGSGKTESSDITYATPIFWLWPIIRAKFPNANLHPVFNQVRLFLPSHPFALITDDLDTICWTVRHARDLRAVSSRCLPVSSCPLL